MEDAGNFFAYFAATQTLLYLQNQEASTCCNIITFWGANNSAVSANSVMTLAGE